ncbi:site-specific integrase [Paraburkholderia phosphatilytica]|uniref:site-specific integrase n=1 Tax=Paraburkholderia phosphatilytica TaxID=2282883 RepID=UPI000E4B6E34|nr:site-specific integrase [Paraburkholderia phosphatilytica]
MASITARTGANGKTTYKAQVRIRRNGIIVHQETKTFDRRAAADSWGKKREVELAQPGALEGPKVSDPPLSDVIKKYLSESKRLASGKVNALTLIADASLGKLPCSMVTPNAIIEYGREQEKKGNKPSTTANYLSHLRAVFKVAQPAWGYPLRKAVIIEGNDVLHELGLSSSSDSRDRRPSIEEISQIVEWLYARWLKRQDTAPYHLMVLFAMFSARRASEIRRMKWSDIDRTGCRLLVFDMKDPRKKIGNHVWVEMTYEALRVVSAAPRAGDVIFPYGKAAVSGAFKEACDALKIEDLRFHDLRHEGVSRLFEMGFSIPSVAAMSGHKTWIHLKRYAHIRASGDKYARWKWLDLIAPLPQRFS